MNTRFQTATHPSVPNGLSEVFPHADKTIVSALATQGPPLLKYLAQTHDLTEAEVAEAVGAFFGEFAPEHALAS